MTLKSRKHQFPHREELHKQFAGDLYLSDFNTAEPSRHNISRIVIASVFNEQCRQSYQERRCQTYEKT